MPLQKYEPTPAGVLETRIMELKRLAADGAEVEELVERLKFVANTVISAPIEIKRSRLIFRGTSIEEGSLPNNIARLGAPPPHLVPIGRCNRVGEPYFYGASVPSVTFHELKKQPGEKLIVSAWEVVEAFNVVALGYDSSGFKTLDPAGNAIPSREPIGFPWPELLPETATLYRFFAEVFGAVVPREETWRYNLSIALTAFFTHRAEQSSGVRDTGVVEGIVYPTVQGKGYAANIAIRADAASRCLRFVRAFEWMHTRMDKERFNVKVLFSMRAEGCQGDGRIHWQNTYGCVSPSFSTYNASSVYYSSSHTVFRKK